MDRKIISLLERFKEESELEDTSVSPEEIIRFGKLNAGEICMILSISLPGERVELKSLNPDGVVNYIYSGLRDSIRLDLLGYKLNDLGIWVERNEKEIFRY